MYVTTAYFICKALGDCVRRDASLGFPLQKTFGAWFGRYVGGVVIGFVGPGCLLQGMVRQHGMGKSPLLVLVILLLLLLPHLKEKYVVCLCVLGGGHQLAQAQLVSAVRCFAAVG